MSRTQVLISEPIPESARRQDRPAGVCVIGAGAIGSLIAAHLSRVAPVVVLTRREAHARALREHGLRVSGIPEFVAALDATSDPGELPQFDVGIIATKATAVDAAVRSLAGGFVGATLVTIQNGLGVEEIIREHGAWPIVAGTTLLGGTRHSDTHVELELDAPTWLGPHDGVPFAEVERIVSLFRDAGLEAEGFPDLAPARWSKLVFNAAVGTISAVTELPHSPPFVDEDGLGGLVRSVIAEGMRVAAAADIDLAEDPWGLNIRAVDDEYAHPPSILLDVLARRQTEVDFNIGAVVREAGRLGVSVPLSEALYALLKGKEAAFA